MSKRVAVVQRPPAMLNRNNTLALASAAIAEAATEGASLVVFPEAYVPGYPTWIWRLRPGGDMALANDIHARLRGNAVDLSGEDLAPVAAAAREHGVTVVLGVNELDDQFSNTTLFNTVVVIGPDGALRNRHRKLMPTNPERMVWGRGDATGLRAVDTPVGRIGCLICWESYMPLARYALFAQGIEILINPTWDNGEMCLATWRHIAREGGVWVIGTATALQGSDMPTDFPDRERLFDDAEWINPGGATVIGPSGAVVAGPLHRDKSILYADIDREAALQSRRSLDVSGHYSRPDLFTLTVNRTPMQPVAFTGDSKEPVERSL